MENKINKKGIEIFTDSVKQELVDIIDNIGWDFFIDKISEYLENNVNAFMYKDTGNYQLDVTKDNLSDLFLELENCVWLYNTSSYNAMLGDDVDGGITHKIRETCINHIFEILELKEL